MVVVVGEEWNLELTGVEESALFSFWAEVNGYTIFSVLYDGYSVVENVHSFGGKVVDVLEIDTTYEWYVGDCFKSNMIINK